MANRSNPSSYDRVDAWTIDTITDSLAAAIISPHRPRGQTVQLSIPLDDIPNPPSPAVPPQHKSAHTVHKRREPIHRDSLKSRDAILKGKEGSRQRRRWEKDRLLDNPHAQPPLPEDWEVRPWPLPRQSVPYFLAPLWDAEMRATALQRQARRSAHRRGGGEVSAADAVARELRAKLKKARSAKGLLIELECEVRGFVAAQDAFDDSVATDSEDEEVVFVGRDVGRGAGGGGARRDRDKLVFQSAVDDRGASFAYVLFPGSPSLVPRSVRPDGTQCDWPWLQHADYRARRIRRYLVHSIAQYYGLETWSVTAAGNPATRGAYVGLPGNLATRAARVEMPRPLWAVV